MGPLTWHRVNIPVATMTAGSRLLCLLLAAVALLDSGSARRCSEYSKACGDCCSHTFCLFPGSGFAEECGTVLASGVTAEDQNMILDQHNGIREMVSRGDFKQDGLPAACRPIRHLTWNPEAAEIAQRLANQCQLKRDRCRNLKDGTYSGQNIAILLNGAKDWQHVIPGAWFAKELGNVSNALDGRKFKTGFAAHLTQVIWDRTTSVGCGYVEFKNEKHVNPQGLYVCNYAPGGNVIGQDVYPVQQMCPCSL